METKPWYKQWWGILLAICVWPFFLSWYVWKKTNWSEGAKGFTTVAIALVFIVGLALAGSKDPVVDNTEQVQRARTYSPATTPSTQVNSNTPTPTPKTSTTTTPRTATSQPTPTPKAAPPTTPATPKVSAEYTSALYQATTYANTMHFSKQGVYDQLVSEYGGKFSAAAAQYAIDNVKADWNANALAQARTYQDTMHMSPAAVRDQLVSEYGGKFTAEEADYAIQHL